MCLVERLATRVEGNPADVQPSRAAADARTRLEDEHVGARAGEAVRGGEAREAGADDEDALVYQTPPSATVIASALTPLASSLARKAMTAAISSGSSTRPAG